MTQSFPLYLLNKSVVLNINHCNDYVILV
uniref:Uncharacterized protein n=1 Tax=Arundo donax TaxID=35708 RepID=A0A0A8ZE65_ARUDO